ncbi:retrovirus-related pol polyprotein from transposon TNT 1-94 [Tanacetum coccineum]
MKNKVEAHHRKSKSSDNKNNHVSDCNANVRNVALSKNFDTICLSCNECLFSANHDTCVVQYLKKMQKRKVVKSVKQKVKSEWKPTGRIFTSVRLRWKPTRRMFNKEGKICPIIKTSPATIVSFGNRLHTIRLSAVASNAETKIRYSIAKNSLIRAYINSYGHPFNPPNFSFIVEIVLWQFCDLDLKVALREHTYFVRNLEGVDLLSGSHGSNLYTISMADMMKSSLIWLPKLKYTKDHLCLACQMGKSKKESHPHKPKPSTNKKLKMFHMDLCEDADEVPKIIIKFLNQAQVSLNATIRYLRIDNDTEFLNQTLRNYTEDVGITHTTSTVRTPQQNGVVERRNRTLILGNFSLKQILKSSSVIHNPRRRPDLHGLTSGHISTRLMLNQAASTSAKPPTKNDWDLLF